MLKLAKDPEADKALAASAGERYYSGFGFMIASDGLSPIAPPWSSLTAYDLNEGTIKWKIPLGEVPELAAKGIKNTGSHYPKVGPVVTAGGLIFTGTRDKKVRAFDAATGKVLWEHQLDAALEGMPAFTKSMAGSTSCFARRHRSASRRQRRRPFAARMSPSRCRRQRQAINASAQARGKNAPPYRARRWRRADRATASASSRAIRSAMLLTVLADAPDVVHFVAFLGESIFHSNVLIKPVAPSDRRSRPGEARGCHCGHPRGKCGSAFFRICESNRDTHLRREYS